MTGLREDEIDRWVDVIAARVEAEIRKRSSPRPHATPCDACLAGKPCECKGAPEPAAPCGFVAPLIDHTLLKPDATKDEIKKVCEEAKKYGFATVCVNSSNVRYAASLLDGSNVKAIAVVGFPLGAATSGAKAFEAREAIRSGAREIDMVLNIGSLKSKDYAVVLCDIRAVVEAAGAVPVKVILETSMLDHDQKVVACALAKAAGAAFVKTSTGFGGGGATPEDIALMRSIVGEEMGVKASGGVRTFDDAERFIDAGASRIGASASVAIVHCKRSEPEPNPRVREQKRASPKGVY